MSASGSRLTTGLAEPPPTSPADFPSGDPHKKKAAPAARPPARRSRVRRTVLVYAARLALLLALLGTWQGLASANAIEPLYYGSPLGVWSRLQEWITVGTAQGSLGRQIWVTFQEVLAGFGIGVSLGVTVGILLGRMRFLSDILSPYIRTLNSIPRIALGSLFTIWFGLGIGGKVALVVVMVFFGVFLNAFQGTREADRNVIANARVLGASQFQVTMQVAVPSALSWITASLHIAFGHAMTGAVVGELLGANEGLGQLISQSMGNFDANGAYAGIFIIAVIAMAALGLITLLERRLLRWQPQRQDGADNL
jgi:NitT/TauT family transport system permease protein